MRNAATTINFSSLRMRALSIDTHVLRIGQRLGLLAPTADIARAYAGYMRLVPDAWDGDDLYELHWLLKQHGQQVCSFAAPKCGACVLADICPQRGAKAERGERSGGTTLTPTLSRKRERESEESALFRSPLPLAGEG
jgi:endonuclease III